MGGNDTVPTAVNAAVGGARASDAAREVGAQDFVELDGPMARTIDAFGIRCSSRSREEPRITFGGRNDSVRADDGGCWKRCRGGFQTRA